MSERGSFYLGNNTETFLVSPVPGNVVSVKLWVDDSSYVQSPAAGTTETGITVEADCPYATQEIADNILTALKAHDYKPYTATRAEVPPYVELGDGVTSNGVYSGVYTISKNFSRNSAADISAPVNTETIHEFQYTNEQERKFIRQVGKLGSEIGQKMDKIWSTVTSDGGSFGWELTDSSMVWKSNGSTVMTLNKDGLKIEGTLNARAVITGELEVGGTKIGAVSLASGAMYGNSWYTSEDFSYGGNTYTGAGFASFNGAGGFQFGASVVYNTSIAPAYFTVTRSLRVQSSYVTPIEVSSIGLEVLGLPLE